jgi:hypothetical protein
MGVTSYFNPRAIIIHGRRKESSVLCSHDFLRAIKGECVARASHF